MNVNLEILDHNLGDVFNLTVLFVFLILTNSQPDKVPIPLFRNNRDDLTGVQRELFERLVFSTVLKGTTFPVTALLYTLFKLLT